jgi:hypothetical protein
MSKDSVAFGPRADRLLSAAAAVTAAATGSGIVGPVNTAEAEIIHSGAVNIVIPDTTDGLYMNLITGVTSGDPGNLPAGWDINPYSTVVGTTFNLWAANTTTWLFTAPVPPATANQYVQPVGTAVNGTQTFGRPGNSINFAAAGGQATLGADNYFGVQFQNEATGATNFGWVKITFGATPGVRAITEYAYENAGASINIGQITAVPEPTTLALLATGATGLIALRRRRQAA